MDFSAAGYLTAIPLIVAIISVWWPLKPNFNAKKILYPYHIVIASLLALIFVTDISLYHFWQYKLDSSIFVFINSPKGMAAGVSWGYVLIRLLAVFVVARIIFKRLNSLSPNTFNFNDEAPSGRVALTLCLIATGGLVFIGIRGGVKESTMNVGRVYYCDNNFLNHSAVNPAFSFFSSIGKNKDFQKQYSFMPSEKAEAIVDSLYTNNGVSSQLPDNQTITPTNQSQTDSLTKHLLKTNRPNILIIIMESFGSTFTKATYGADNKAVTPNFVEEAQKSVLFNNFYCNSFRTDRGLVSTLSGYPALPTGSLMKMPKVVEHLPGLASRMAREGYSTSFLYGGDINFTNTKGYLKRTGFQRIIADTDFSAKERRSNKWGVNDEFTFARLLTEIKSQKPDSQYFISFLTLSSHEPFEVPLNKIDDKVYNAAAYTDSCLGRFMTELRKTPQWGNLLIIMLPDHNMLHNVEHTDPEYFHCSMLWGGGAIVKPQTVETLMNQSDMAATLLGQLGLSHENFPLSRDVLSEGYRSPFVFCSYNNNFMTINGSDTIYYDLLSKKCSKKGDAALEGKALLQHEGKLLNEYNSQ